MSNANVVWPIEPHTVAKHDILRRYLEAWFPIMAKYVQKSGGNRLVYVDGFAGPGEYSRGEKGSPVIALETLLAHKLWPQRLAHLEYTFLFVEADQERASHLKGLVSKLDIPPNVECYIEHGQFERVLTPLLDSLKSRGVALAPAFVFIDPFGPTGFGMALVQRLLAYRGSEVLITLNLRALDRWWLPIPDKHSEVDALFGTTTWRDCLNVTDTMKREQCLKSAYRAQLAQVATSYVRDFRQVNKHNQSAYYMLYATHHPKGLAVMKQAMWSVDPSGAFSYSDVTNPNQPFLFEAAFEETHVKNFAQELLETCRGKVIPKATLRRLAEEHPDYLERHLTRAIEFLVSQSGVTPSLSKRGRGWPDSTTFTFPL